MSLSTNNVPDIYDRFNTAVRRFGSSAAIEFDKRTWSYEELDRLSDALASSIQGHVSIPGSIVVIDCERSPILVLTMLACVKAGMVFFVLGENQPESYIANALEDVRNIVWLGSEGYSDRAKAQRISGDRLSGYLGLEKSHMEHLDDGYREISRRVSPPAGDRAFYLVATSGTTGRPKLVLTNVGPILNFIDWYREAFLLSCDDKFSMLSGLGYDPLIRDIFVPLCIGACVSIPSNEALTTRRGLHGWIDAAGVSVIHATPQLAQLIFPRDETVPLGSVRVMAVGGSPLSSALAQHVKSLLVSGSLVNVYGTTETPQVMCYHVCGGASVSDAASGNVPIGKPIRAVDIQVVGDEGLTVRDGDTGEIHVLTPHLAVGYYEAQELTRDKFSLHDALGTRVYRTGDLGFVDVDGNLHYVGRRDRQVKHRGYRIQLEEIEHAAQDLGQVVAAAVVYEELNDSTSGAGKIVCYLQTRPGAFFEESGVKQELMKSLPAYMMPDSYVVLEKMPQNSRHKIDYAALKSIVAVPGVPARPKTLASAPNNMVTKELLAMWAEVLGTPATAISLDKNFFDIGGNSLLSVALIKNINRVFSKKLTVTDLYIYSNISELSKHISRESESHAPPEHASGVSRRADNLSKVRATRNRRDGIKL
ncbi:MAG TPA: non-ribosomal peptide synthetase [Burkholderiaceae bacterium]